MTQDRDCNTCENHVQAGSLDDQPPICWSCSSASVTGPNRLPYWKPMCKAYDAAFRPDIEKQVTGAIAASVAADLDKELAAKPLDTQVGGNHYKGMRIQPLEFALVNGLDPAQCKVVKYVCRKKGGLSKRLEDLDKAIHVIQLYKQLLTEGKIPLDSKL